MVLLPRRVHPVRGPAVWLAVALALGPAAGCAREPDVATIVARTVALPGQLSGTARIAAPPEQGLTASEARRLRDLLGTARERVVADPTVGARHDLAAAEIAAGDLDLAIARLTVLAGETGSARSHNDLAVARLARFERSGDPVEVLRALVAAQKALAVEPAHAEALYNQAVAATRLNLRHLAEAAWRQVEAAAVADPNLVRAQLAARTAPRAVDSWYERRALIDPARGMPGDEALRAAAASYALHSRTWGLDELLPRWGAALEAGDPAARDPEHPILAVAGRLGELHDEMYGEAMLNEAVRAATAALGSSTPAALARIGRAHRLYGEAVVDFEAQATNECRRKARAASEVLREIGSPLAYWADFYAAIVSYYEDTNEGRRQYLAIERAIEGRHFEGLLGRVHWVLGTVDVVQVRPDESMRRYRLADRLLRSVSGEAAVAFVDVLLAEALGRTGDHQSSWRHRFRAMQTVPDWELPRRVLVTYTEGAAALLNDRQPELAMPLLAEALAVAEEAETPFMNLGVLERRAHAYLQLGMHEQARRDIATARAALAAMEPGGLREIMRYFVDLDEGELLIQEDPPRAVELLTRAFQEQEDNGYALERPRYLAYRARAHRASGDDRSAMEDLLAAVESFESMREGVADPARRVRAFRQARTALEDLTRMALAEGERGVATAFGYVERSRGRMLLDRWLGAAGNELVGLEGLADRLPRGTTVVQYAALRDETVAWVIERGKARLVRLPLARDELRQQVALFRAQLESRAPESAVLARGGALYGQLIEPLELSFPQTLAIVPGPVLDRLPFGALYDAARERYLIEAAPLVVAPSATLLLLASDRLLLRSGPPAGALLVGVGEGFAEELALPPLPGVEREVRGIAPLYEQQAELLVGTGATQRQFLARLGRHDVIHFSGHAVPDALQPFESGLALVGSSREESLLTVRDLIAADWRGARLVVLSSCSTLGFEAEDLSGVFGLAGALMAAEVPSVLAALWQADDRFLPGFMNDFHRRFSGGGDPAHALRAAVLDSLRDPDRGFTHPHYWAGFALLGGVGPNGGNDGV